MRSNAASARTSALQNLIEHAEAAYRSSPTPTDSSASVADKIFRALDDVAEQSPTNRDGQSSPSSELPACASLGVALRSARRSSPPVALLADALAELVDDVAWQRRPNARSGPEGFFDGHANAVLVGPDGIERRDDVMVGLSLLSPNVRYPDHRHPPEEFYVVLSPGEWRQGGGAWHSPGPGGVVHNPPGIVHAMRSGDEPLLALWFFDSGAVSR